MTTTTLSLRVLYLEDNPVDSDLMRRELATAAPDLHLELVTTLSAALEQLAVECPPFDVILSDMRLPDGSGLDLLRHVRERGLPLAVVIITGSGDQETAVAALKAGADDYLVKQAGLADNLARVLSLAHAGHQRRRERRGRPLHVLYAEPNSVDSDLTRRHLAQHAPYINLEVVCSGEDLLSRMSPVADQAVSPDVLVLDYRLPGLNALEVVKTLRQERCLALPILLVSGQGTEEISVRALQLGVDEYLVKREGYLVQLPAVLEKLQKQAELNESEERFRVAQELSPDGFTILRPVRDDRGYIVDFTWIYENATIARLSGTDPREVVGRRLLELFPGHRESLFFKTYQHVAETGELSIIEDYYQGESIHTLTWFRLTVVRMGQDIAVYAQDVTERKKEEIRRDVSNAVLQVLNESSDLKDSLERVITLLRMKMEIDAVAIRLQEGEDYPYLVQAGFSKDFVKKENFLVERNLEGEICRNEDGTICLECTCGQVISGKTSPDDQFFTPGGSFWTNDSFPLLHLAADQESRHNPRNECIRHDYASIALIPVRCKDKIVGLLQCNDRRRGRFTLESIQHLEGIAAYIGAAVMRKCLEAERINLEEQLHQAQKLESVGRLASGVAHDFNNMLGVIIGHASLALHEMDQSAPLYRDMKGIYSAALRSADITRQLLTFASKQTIEPSVLVVNDAISGMIKMLQRLLGEDIQLDFHPGTTMGPVKIDPSQIDQIMANLCVNARDAIQGVGKINIETGTIVIDNASRKNPEAEAGEYVFISVTDNGSGMDKETMSHIYEPFFTTKAVGKGTGLGLATVYGIVKQNKGFIEVQSVLDQGTTFTIYFPRYLGKPVPMAQSDAAVPLPEGTETILLVEDESTMLDIVTVLLQKLGYMVLPAGSPGEAIQLAREYRGDIDLVMTDVIMPEMNGNDLARFLGTMTPTIKCLFMSGYTADIVAHQGVIADETHFIQKPFQLPALAVKVREVLDQKQAPGLDIT